MIDVGFNLLTWAVLKRRNIQFVDKNLCELMNDSDPYEKLIIEKKTDLAGRQAKLISLARGMALSESSLFSATTESTEWINQIIRERDDDETRITGKAFINDSGDCLAKISVQILSERRKKKQARPMVKSSNDCG